MFASTAATTVIVASGAEIATATACYSRGTAQAQRERGRSPPVEGATTSGVSGQGQSRIAVSGLDLDA
jgi:hypothetical protein